MVPKRKGRGGGLIWGQGQASRADKGAGKRRAHCAGEARAAQCCGHARAAHMGPAIDSVHRAHSDSDSACVASSNRS
jgi:hypothetical protein